MSAIASGPSADVPTRWRDGERTLHAAVTSLPDADLAGPSLLPGWSRQTLLAHLARNGDALVNLLTWARTGVETVMYASAEARDEEIAETAATGSGSAEQIGIWTTRKSLASLLPRS